MIAIDSFLNVIFQSYYNFCTFVVWITFRRKDFEIVKKEIGRYGYYFVLKHRMQDLLLVSTVTWLSCHCDSHIQSTATFPLILPNHWEELLMLWAKISKWRKCTVAKTIVFCKLKWTATFSCVWYQYNDCVAEQFRAALMIKFWTELFYLHYAMWYYFFII